MVADGEGNESKSGVRDAGHPSVGHERDTGSAFEIDNEFGSARHLVVLVVAHGFRFDGVVVQQLLGLTCVFAGNDVRFLEDAEGAERDVLENGSLHRVFLRDFGRAEVGRSYKS